jgi:hypothetical protein
MTISRSEFLRLLPAAVGGVPFDVTDGVISHECAERGWRITLTALPDRVHGPIRLERQRVEFAFRGYCAEELAAFFRRFDLYFARGGG